MLKSCKNKGYLTADTWEPGPEVSCPWYLLCFMIFLGLDFERLFFFMFCMAFDESGLTYIHTCMHALHYITLHCITLHYITLHYIPLRCVALNYITLHYLHPYMYACMHAYIYAYIMKRSCQETSHRHLAQRSCQKTSYRDLCKESSYRDLVQRACQQTSFGGLVQRPGEESTSFARKSYIDSLNRDLIQRFLTKNFCGDLL